MGIKNFVAIILAYCVSFFLMATAFKGFLTNTEVLMILDIIYGLYLTLLGGCGLAIAGLTTKYIIEN